MPHRFILKIAALLIMVATLSACEDSEERAERYFQSGMTLLEEGDVERALIEFRNVFNLNGSHREARQTYARIVREQGKLREANGQYLRLIEQYPDDLEGRIALSEMAFASQNWDEFDRHIEAAIELDADAPRVKTLTVARDYRAAALDEDNPAREAAFAQALTLVETQPDSPILQEIEIDGYIRDSAYAKALTVIDRVLEKAPDNRNMYNVRLSILSKLGDNDAIEDQLRNVVTRFPEEDAVKQTLIRFYMSRQEPEKAEAFLREIADPDAEDPKLYLTLLQFIGQLRGPDAMMAELDDVIPKVEDPALYRAMRAGLLFEQGERAQGIAETEDIIAGAEPSPQISQIKVGLAQMLLQTGNEVGARRLIEEVLANDSTQVDALRMSAAWQIEADDTTAAIATLRNALDQAPQDVASMSLMSEAYLRAGNRDLARDFLSLAVDSSGQAPAEAVRYARFLSDEKRYIPAEQILVSALRTNRDNQALLIELGRTYLLMEDTSRLRQVIADLKRLEGSAAEQAAASFEANLIERESGTEAAINFLEGISKDWDNALSATLAVVRARLVSGDKEAALQTARIALEEDDQDPARRYLMAATQAATGNLAAAEVGFRALLDEYGNEPRIWIELIRTVSAQGKSDEMRTLLEQGLAANPDAGDLLWVQATLLESSGDIEGAIGIYEKMYEKNSNSVVVANNLASLLASYRDDPESLERAATVARRLRDTDQPAFQDTWGWIAFRQGDVATALAPLEAAAEGLPRDALTQYHLGMVYEALSRPKDAIAQFEKAVALAGPDNTSAAIADARTRLETLKAGAQQD